MKTLQPTLRLLKASSILSAILYFACGLYCCYIWFIYRPRLEDWGSPLMGLHTFCAKASQVMAIIHLATDIFFIPLLYKAKRNFTAYLLTDIFILIIEGLIILLAIIFSGAPQF